VIPKAELHVHLEGTAPPDLIRRLAERNGMLVPDGVFDTPERFAYTDFLDFLRTYDLAASVIRTGDDYRDVTYEYLAGCAREGALYVELTASPDHAALVGLSDEEHLDGIARGKGYHGFSLFEIAPLGLAYSVVGLLYLGLVAWRRLPEREPPPGLSAGAEGEPDAVGRVLAWMRIGPPRAMVTRVAITDEAPRNEHGFHVR